MKMMFSAYNLLMFFSLCYAYYVIDVMLNLIGMIFNNIKIPHCH